MNLKNIIIKYGISDLISHLENWHLLQEKKKRKRSDIRKDRIVSHASKQKQEKIRLGKEMIMFRKTPDLEMKSFLHRTNENIYFPHNRCLYFFCGQEKHL